MNETRGQFSQVQIRALLAAVNPKRVVVNEHTKPHLSQQDVLAHLSRIFGFGRFDVEVVSVECIFETPMVNRQNKDAWSVGYRALVRLTVRNERQELVAHFDGGSTGESEGQPSRADSHDLAMKSALSTATKRAAIHLGDQFGLSLYNKGQLSALVMGTLVDGLGPQDQSAVDAEVQQQEEDGGATADRIAAEQDEAAEAPQAPARKTPTVGRQGTRRPTASEQLVEKRPPAAERLVATMEAQAEPVVTEAVATVEPEPDPAAPAAPVEPEPAATPSQVTGEEIVHEKVYGSPEGVRRETEREKRRQEAADTLAGQRAVEQAEREEAEERARFAAEQEERVRAEDTDEVPEPEWDGGPAVLADDDHTPATWAQLIDAGKVYEALEVAGYDTTMTGEARMAQVRGVWDTAEATDQMTTELRMAINRRRDELKRELEEALRVKREAAKAASAE